MRKYLFILCLALFLAACGGGSNDNVPANNVNTKPVNSNKENPLAITTPTPAATTNNAPTLTPVYKAYCDAMVKGDEAALRRIFSSDTIRGIDAKIRQEAIKPPTIVKYLEDEQVTNDLCEVRNEQINGNEAIAEVRTKGTPNGVLIVFVKEGADWKLTNRSPTLKK
jgi:hypothetical protein